MTYLSIILLYFLLYFYIRYIQNQINFTQKNTHKIPNFAESDFSRITFPPTNDTQKYKTGICIVSLEYVIQYYTRIVINIHAYFIS